MKNMQVEEVELPLVHTGGTSSKQLMEGYKNAMTAVRAAINAVAYAGPNGRDYVNCGPDAMKRALWQHEGRLAALEGVHFELRKIADEVYRQQLNIERNKLR